MNEIRCAPHVHTSESTSRIMLSVAAALLPAMIGSIYYFGPGVMQVVTVCVAFCLLSEVISKKLFGRTASLKDGSALVTGILLAFVLPPGIPLWIAALGSFLAIFLTKELFGGLGFNIFNPALTARTILLVSFPVQMTTSYLVPFSYRTDAITGATPLATLKEGLDTGIPTAWEMFMAAGRCIGQTNILLLAGAAFLLLRRIITLHIPLSFILTVALLSLATGQDPVFQVMAGGLILGAFFMATDYVTSPLMGRGKIIFGAGCGIVTFLIRQKGGYLKAWPFSILFMNMFVPLIDRYTLPTKFGFSEGKKMKRKKT